MTLPTLYKQTTAGAIQQWQVRVSGVEVVTTYGQLGGAVQTTSDTVRAGKNVGRSNERGAEAQALAQARQQWDKKKKQGYTEDLALAKASQNTLDAVKPMLAHVYEDCAAAVRWPQLAQPKLDGLRNLAVVKQGRCQLYSRTQKPIDTMPHIVAAIEELAADRGVSDFILDGELYADKYADDFNEIISITKRKDIHPRHTEVQYHIYDLASHGGGFAERHKELEWLMDSYDYDDTVVVVATHEVESEDAMFDLQGDMLAQGYEGLMLRDPNSLYEGKRSKGLLKVKTFRDAEFEVVGVEEGSGKLQGRAGALVCVTAEGKRFKAKMRGALASLEDYLVNFDKYRGRMLTVKFQGLTPGGAPRFPVGMRFREEE